MAFQAAAWRDRQAYSMALSGAWHSAAFARVKRMPTHAQLMKRVARPRRLAPIEKRRLEFDELKASMMARVRA
jgi:hypothetical protein